MTERSILATGLFLATFGAAGCGAGAAGAVGAETRPAAADPYAADRAAVADRGPLPDPIQMNPDVQVVSFAYMDGTVLRRDTLRGRADVDRWLRTLRSRTVRNPRFALRTNQVQICDGAAVEVGRFPNAAITAMDGLRRVRGTEEYLALWTPVADGWQLQGLWLQPAGMVRPGTLASGCGASEIARRETRQFRFGLALRRGGGADMTPVLAILEEDWPDPSVTEGGAGGPRAWLSWRPVSWLGIRPMYDYLLPSSAGDFEGDADASRSIDLEVSAHQLTILTEAKAGPVWLSAGPVLTWLRVVESGHVIAPSGVSNREIIERGQLVGGMAEATVRVTRVPTVVPILSVGYTWFPELRPELTDPAPVPLGGLTFSAGLEWAF